MSFLQILTSSIRGMFPAIVYWTVLPMIPFIIAEQLRPVGEAPQYTLVIRDWKTDVPADETTFAFTPPEGAKKVGLEALANLDEVPPAAAPEKGQQP